MQNFAVLAVRHSKEKAISRFCTVILSLLPLLFYSILFSSLLFFSPLFYYPSAFSQCQGRQSLLMRIYLTQYSMRENPVCTVRLRDSRYPLACSATGPAELPSFGDSAREITRERNEQRWKETEHNLPLSLCINSIVA